MKGSTKPKKRLRVPVFFAIFVCSWLLLGLVSVGCGFRFQFHSVCRVVGMDKSSACHCGLPIRRAFCLDWLERRLE